MLFFYAAVLTRRYSGGFMKRWITGIAALLFAACAFAGGSKDAAEPMWHSDLESALEAARHDKKNVFFAVTGDDPANRSQVLLYSIFNDPAFTDAMAKDYVLANIDFSTLHIASVELPASATEEQQEQEQKQTVLMQDMFQKNYEAAALYSVSEVPAVLILSPEGYVIASVADDAAAADAASYLALLSSQQSAIDSGAALVEAVRAAKGADKLRAVDALYTATPAAYQYVLAGLVEEALTLDKKNETGLLGKYTLQNAYYTAMEVFAGGDAAAAAQCFADAAAQDVLTPAEKQEAYYLAAYVLVQSNPETPDQVLAYLEQAHDADPENENAQLIQQTIDQLREVQTLMEAERAAAAGSEAGEEAPVSDE